MEYGIGIMFSLNKWRRPSGSEKKVDPAPETRKREKHKKNRETALQVDSPPDKICSAKYIGPSKYGARQTDGEG
jgi:hypothetical protein